MHKLCFVALQLKAKEDLEFWNFYELKDLEITFTFILINYDNNIGHTSNILNSEFRWFFLILDDFIG